MRFIGLLVLVVLRDQELARDDVYMCSFGVLRIIHLK